MTNLFFSHVKELTDSLPTRLKSPLTHHPFTVAGLFLYEQKSYKKTMKITLKLVILAAAANVKVALQGFNLPKSHPLQFHSWDLILEKPKTITETL